MSGSLSVRCSCELKPQCRSSTRSCGGVVSGLETHVALVQAATHQSLPLGFGGRAIADSWSSYPGRGLATTSLFFCSQITHWNNAAGHLPMFHAHHHRRSSWRWQLPPYLAQFLQGTPYKHPNKFGAASIPMSIYVYICLYSSDPSGW